MMSSYLDSSVLIEAVLETQTFHRDCVDLLDEKELRVRSHGLSTKDRPANEKRLVAGTKGGDGTGGPAGP